MKAAVSVVVGALLALQVCAVPVSLNCVPGQYVKNHPSGPVCANCLTGYFSTTNNAASCARFTQCVAGQFVNAAGTSSSDRDCQPCGSGTFSTISNAASCSAHRTCPAHKYEARAPSATNDRLCQNCLGGVCTTTTPTTTTPTTTTTTTTSTTTPSTSVTTLTATDIPKSIADLSSVNSVLSVSLPAGASIVDMSVTINIQHTYDADLWIFLKAPNGKVLNLVGDSGSSGDNFVNTVFSSTSTTSILTSSAPLTGTFGALGSLTNYNRGNFQADVTTFPGLYSVPSGQWTLQVMDDSSADVGTLIGWSLTITYSY